MSTSLDQAVIKYRYPTTCLECGAVGEGESNSPGIVHKTILCGECQAKLRVGRARLTLRLARADSDDTATFELGGIDLWLVAMVPNIAMFVEAAVRIFQTDRAMQVAAGDELGRALEAVMVGRPYEGKFVTVTREAGPCPEVVASVNG